MTDQNNKPSLDEQTFSKLLEAAFVLQEHNREMRQMEESLELQSEQLRQQEAVALAALQKSSPQGEETVRENSDYTLTLAEIVEAQHQIQIRHLRSDEAMAIIAERISRITNASGAGIALLDGKMIRYQAGAGAPALPPGSEILLEKAICSMCVRTGQVLRTPDVNTEFLFDPELCYPRGILSLVAVPVYHDGNIVGALELYFDRPQGYAEQDIHTCQLMAGLVTEAIGRAAESAMKKTMAAEHSSMLAAIEKLRPSLAAIARDSLPEPSASTLDASVDTAQGNVICWKCGNKLIAEEQFCGKCGAPRVGDTDPSSLQSKLASAWHTQQSRQEDAASTPAEAPMQSNLFPVSGDSTESEARFPPVLISPRFGENEPKALQSGDTRSKAVDTAASLAEPALRDKTENRLAPSVDSVQSPTEVIARSSSTKTRDFLEAFSESQSPSALARFWRARRGDFYLAIALLVVAIVVRWGILSDHSVGATGGAVGNGINATRRALAPNADLSTFDKLLVKLGLAEAPETPEYKGNPDAHVWIDPHTALYYCPGSELYGKTANGKYASQREAQLDQFESASRRACD